MSDIEELEHRLTRLESLYEDVLKEKLTAITVRLDTRLVQLYEKTERDKTINPFRLKKALTMNISESYSSFAVSAPLREKCLYVLTRKPC